MSEEKVLHEFYVAGVKFHQLHEVIKEVEVDEHLTLEPEPSNPFDPNAVKILRDEVMLGYVPKKISAEVCAELEIGPVKCIVSEINPGEKPWVQLKVKLVEGE